MIKEVKFTKEPDETHPDLIGILEDSLSFSKEYKVINLAITMRSSGGELYRADAYIDAYQLAGQVEELKLAILGYDE